MQRRKGAKIQNGISFASLRKIFSPYELKKAAHVGDLKENYCTAEIE